jgi:hypothetical protein
MDLMAAIRIWQAIYKHAILVGTIGRLLMMSIAVSRDGRARAYMDQALEPVRDDEDMTLGLFTETAGARAEVAHVKKIAALTGAGQVRRLNGYAEAG